DPSAPSRTNTTRSPMGDTLGLSFTAVPDVMGSICHLFGDRVSNFQFSRQRFEYSSDRVHASRPPSLEMEPASTRRPSRRSLGLPVGVPRFGSIRTFQRAAPCPCDCRK